MKDTSFLRLLLLGVVLGGVAFGVVYLVNVAIEFVQMWKRVRRLHRRGLNE